MGTSDEINEFRKWKFGDTTDKVGNDTSNSSQPMEGKLAGNVRSPGVIALLLEGVCERDEPDPGYAISFGPTAIKQVFIKLLLLTGSTP
jgi:hypothetical protein